MTFRISRNLFFNSSYNRIFKFSIPSISHQIENNIFSTRSGSVADLAGFLQSTYNSRCFHFLSRVTVFSKKRFFHIEQKREMQLLRDFSSIWADISCGTLWNYPIIYKHVTPVDSLTSKSTVIELGFPLRACSSPRPN